MATTLFVNSVTLTDAGWFNDTDTVTYGGLTSIAGTNTVTAAGPASMTAYAARQRFIFIPAATNTGATTLNITPSGGSALGAKSIFFNGTALVGSELKIGVPVIVIYDGTQFNLMNSATLGKQPTRQTFTSGTAATYTTPAGATRILVRMVGGGAGSGSAAPTSGIQASAGGGGGGGSYAEKLFLAPAATYTYTVGVAGTAGVAGGQTSFDTVTAPGGSAGSNGVANNNTEAGIAGGAGGVAGANGDLHVPGGDGGFGIEAGAAYAVGGPGGASGLGFGGTTHNTRTVTTAAGVAGKLYGGGAAGAANSVSQGSAAGASGAAGIIIVDEWYN